MVRKILLGVGGGVGEGARKKFLTSRDQAEGLYEFPKILKRGFSKTQNFHMVHDGNGMIVPIYQEEVVLCFVLINFSIRSLIFGKTANR